MYEILLEPSMYLEAERRTDQFMQHLFNRFGYDDQMRREKAYIGILGELAFEKFCQDYNIPYQPGEYLPEQNSDTCDFYINGHTIDIKIAELSTYNMPNDNWTYGYPVEQHPEQKYAVIVGLYNREYGLVSFYGIISGKKIQSFPIVTQNSYAGYQYLTPNYEFSYGDLSKNIPEIINNYF